MRKFLAAAALIALGAATAACDRSERDAGPMVSRTYPVGAFDQVEAAGPFDITIRTGAAPSVQVHGNQSLVDRLQVDVDGGKLRIRPQSEHGFFHWGFNNAKADISITVPTLRAATLAGAGDVKIDKVQGDQFEGQIAGAGELTIDSVEVGLLKIGVAGHGDATIHAGKATAAEYTINGAGDVDTSAVQSETLKVSIAGAGDVKAHATATADVSVMGAGDVTVTGGAKCTVHKSGAGDVHCS